MFKLYRYEGFDSHLIAKGDDLFEIRCHLSALIRDYKAAGAIVTDYIDQGSCTVTLGKRTLRYFIHC